jgi:hypothetical protein
MGDTASVLRQAQSPFVEKREREQQAKRPRAKTRTKKPETSPQEFEGALDDLASDVKKEIS